MSEIFFKNLVKNYRKKPHLSESENVELEAYLKKYKVKKKQACGFIGIEYQAYNINERKGTLPRILLDFFRFAEAAIKLAKIEENLK